MDLKKHLETAWVMTLKCIVPLIFMTLLMVFSSILTLGILGPVTMAGYVHSILLFVRDGREPKIQDVFSQMSLFFPLLIFEAVVFLIFLIAFKIMVLPGILMGFALTFCCLYMLPIMTDRKLLLVDAIKESFSMAFHGNLLDHTIVTLLYLGILWVGTLVFMVGWLFTLPLSTVFMLSVYQERIGQRPPYSEFDQSLKQK